MIKTNVTACRVAGASQILPSVQCYVIHMPAACENILRVNIGLRFSTVLDNEYDFVKRLMNCENVALLKILCMYFIVRNYSVVQKDWPTYENN